MELFKKLQEKIRDIIRGSSDADKFSMFEKLLDKERYPVGSAVPLSNREHKAFMDNIEKVSRKRFGT